MAVGSQPGGIHPLALAQLRQPALGVVGFAAGQFVNGLDICLEEAWERDGAPACGEGRFTAVSGVTGDPQAQCGPAGISHLRGDRALPDELVQTEPVSVEFGVQRPRCRECLAGGTDSLMRLLGILDLPGVLPRRGVDVFLAVELTRLIARGVDRRL